MSNRIISEKTKLLLRAKEVINEPNKWTKNKWGENGQYCALGALYRAAGWPGDGTMSVCIWEIKNKELTKKIQKAIRCFPIDNIVGTNDSPQITHADIMRLYDGAISNSFLEEK